MTNVTLLIVAVILGAMRIAGFDGHTYQAIAHLYVGGLFGAFAIARDTESWRAIHAWYYLMLGIALSVLELVCFLVFRFAERGV